MSTFYISPSGNDTTGDGSEGNPWLTISKAFTGSSADDTIQCAAGTYTWASQTFSSGRTIQGAAYNTTIFDAGGGSAVWTTQSSSTLNVLDCKFYDNVGMRMIQTFTGHEDITTNFTRCWFDKLRGAGGFDTAILHFNSSVTSNLKNFHTFTSCAFSDMWQTGADARGGYFNFSSNSTNQTYTLLDNIFYVDGVSGTNLKFIVNAVAGTVLTLKNNIVSNQSGTALNFFERTTPTTNVTSTNNCYHNLTSPPTDTNGITSDPLFYDPTNNDFELRPTSPCLDAGVLV